MTAQSAAGQQVRPRIYLAGFDVFRPDALEYGRSAQRLCDSFGFDAHFPLDSAVPASIGPSERAAWIYRANVEAIRRADIVLANLNDFRGAGEPDSGTAFEVGFAVALGKEVWGYRRDGAALLERVPGNVSADGRLCEMGFLIEDFGLPVNLMIACAARIVTGGPQECLRAIVVAHGTGNTPSRYRLTGGSEIRQV